MKTRYSTLFIFTLCLFTSISSQAKSTAYGAEEKKYGAGVYLGEPIGFTFKGYIQDRLALDGILSWSFSDEAFTIIGDGTYELFDLPVESKDFTLPLYVGAGLKVGINDNNGDTDVGIRIPVGVAMQFNDYPIEIAVELSPGIGIAPDTDLDLTGGLAARFYF